MTIPGAQGEGLPAKKRTAVFTNSKNIAEVLRLAKCQGAHAHEPLVGGRAKTCEVYPQKFVQLMIEGIKKEIQDAKWTRALADQLDIGPVLEKLMAVQTALEAAEPPHETEGDTNLRKVYEGSEFYDDVTGVLLDRELAIKARRVDIKIFRARGAYTKCRRERWMNVITTKLLDVNRGCGEPERPMQADGPRACKGETRRPLRCHAPP